jgi:DNA-binding LacI/PurR family transcriptional regulator
MTATARAMEHPPSSVDEATRAAVAALIKEHGARAAAVALGLSRETVCGVAAGADCLAGTLSLIRERLAMGAKGR